MRGLLRIGAVVGVSVVLVGCWPQPGGGPDRRAHNATEDAITTDTVGDLERVWSVDIGEVESDPVLSGGNLFVRTGDRLYRLDRSTGGTVWSTPPQAPDTTFHGPVIVDDDRVLTASGGSTLFNPETHLYDVESGQPDDIEWDGYVSSLRPPYAGILSRMQHPSGGDLEYLAVRDLDAGTEWRTIVGSPITDITVGEELLYDVGWGLNVTEPTSDHRDIDVGVRAYPLGDHPGNCFEALSACPTWAMPLDAEEVSAPVLSSDGETVYVVADDTVYSLDASTGDVLWTSEGVANKPLAPALADGYLYVPGESGYTHVYAADGCGQSPCRPVWSAHGDRNDGGFGDEVLTQPTVVGSGEDAVLLTMSDWGYVDAYPAAGCGTDECLPVWSGGVSTDHIVDITAAPVVAHGYLFVGTTDGLQAFALP